MNKNEIDLQQKYAEYQILNEQLNQLQQKLNLINNQIQQLRQINVNLEELKSVKKNSEIRFPFGPGIYAEGVLKEDKLLVNVGANVLVKKDIPDTIKIVEEQIKELEYALEDTEKTCQFSIMRIQEIQKEISSNSEDK